MRTVHLTGAILLLLGLLLCRLDGAAAEVSDAARQACTPRYDAALFRCYSGRGEGHGLHESKVITG